MYEEIIASLDDENEIKKENCPFTRSVLLECQRWNPVVDSLLHRASEDIVVDGVFIEKGSTLQGLNTILAQIVIFSISDCCNAQPSELSRAREVHP